MSWPQLILGIVGIWVGIFAAFFMGYHFANVMFHKKIVKAYEAMSALVMENSKYLTADDVITAFENEIHP